MTRGLRPFFRLWPFFALFLLVYLASLGSLRFVLDDWCQIPRLADLMRGEAPGWRGIADNRWLGVPRIFFLTWLLQGSWARIWGLGSSVPYFLAGFGAHLLSCLMLDRILRRAGMSDRGAALAALACLVTPTSSGALFWINCWQFILPVAAFMILADLYASPLRDRRADAAALIAAAVCSQFLGEQILPVLYAGFAWALLNAWRRRGPAERRREVLRVSAPAAASAVSLAVYYVRCVAPMRRGSAAWSWAGAWDGLREAAAVHAGVFSPFSAFYGKGSVAPSPATWALVAVVAAALGWRWLNEEAADPGRPREAPLPPFLAAAAAVFVLAQLPVAAAVAAGARSMEYRYTYLPGLALTAGLILAIRAVAGAGRARAAALMQTVLVVYLAGLTIYDLRDIWGGQKRLDERIWSQIESGYRPGQKFIMTDSQTMAPLMPERSNAISDFKDDFAISCRLHATGRLPPGAGLVATRRYQANYDNGDWLYLATYRGSVYRATPDKILAAAFRYGPTFADMLAGDVRVFPDFEAYKRFRREEKIEFVPWVIDAGK